MVIEYSIRNKCRTPDKEKINFRRKNNLTKKVHSFISVRKYVSVEEKQNIFVSRIIDCHLHRFYGVYIHDHESIAGIYPFATFVQIAIQLNGCDLDFVLCGFY